MLRPKLRFPAFLVFLFALPLDNVVAQRNNGELYFRSREVFSLSYPASNQSSPDENWCQFVSWVGVKDFGLDEKIQEELTSEKTARETEEVLCLRGEGVGAGEACKPFRLHAGSAGECFFESLRLRRPKNNRALKKEFAIFDPLTLFVLSRNRLVPRSQLNRFKHPLQIDAVGLYRPQEYDKLDKEKLKQIPVLTNEEGGYCRVHVVIAQSTVLSADLPARATENADIVWDRLKKMVEDKTLKFRPIENLKKYLSIQSSQNNTQFLNSNFESDISIVIITGVGLLRIEQLKINKSQSSNEWLLDESQLVKNYDDRLVYRFLIPNLCRQQVIEVEP